MIVTVKKRTDEHLINEQQRASAIIPVIAYSEDDHLFLMDDKSLGFSFACTPLNGADEKAQERMNGFLNQEFPHDTILQFNLFRSPDINQMMYQMLGLRDDQRDPLLQTVIQERVQFLQDHTTKRLYSKTKKGIYDNGLVQDLKLFVTCKVPISNHSPSEKDAEMMRNLQVKVESGLQSIGLRPQKITAEHYLRIMNTMLSWGKDAPWRKDLISWDKDKPICEQIFDYDTDIEVSKEGVRLGDHYVKVLSAKHLPKAFYFGDAITYIGDLSGGNAGVHDNYMVVANVFFPNPEKAKGSINRKRQFVVNQAHGPMLKFVPVLADKKHDFDTLYESMSNGSKPVQVSYSIVLFSPDKERAESAAMAIRSGWRENRFEMMEDKFVALTMFINSLPLCTDAANIRDLFRYKTMTTEQAAVVLPLFGEWKGTGTYHAALISRNGQLMSLSLHDSNTNKNLVIAAESGSGKSFLTNELIFAYLSEGAQVWVIDAGKSYQNLCDMLDGDFVQFGEEDAVSLNPFELIEDYEDEEDAIVSLVRSMASVSGSMSEWQTSALKQTMTRLWGELGNKMKIDDIAKRCLEGEDQRLRDIGQQLYPFTSKGSYGRYFSKKNNVNFKNRFTVLELDELNGRKHLRQVVLLQLIYQIQQEVFLGERDRKKIVIVDEAWDLLKEGEVATFMEHAYRKFRKYGGSMGIATQSVNDLYENAVGRAIAENSANMYLLGQTEETVESIKKSGRLSLTEGGYHTLKSVHTVQGVYSEIFIKSKAGIGVGRLIVGAFQQLLYSTTPEDVNAVDQYVKQGLSRVEAMRRVLRDRGQV